MRSWFRRHPVDRVPSIESCYPADLTPVFTRDRDELEEHLPGHIAAAPPNPVAESSSFEGAAGATINASQDCIQVPGQQARIVVMAAPHGIHEPSSVHRFKPPTAPQKGMQVSKNTGTVLMNYRVVGTSPRDQQLAADPTFLQRMTQLQNPCVTFATWSSPQTRPHENLLSEEMKEVYINLCVPLYHAAIKGDWKIAEDIIAKRPSIVRERIARGHETALHIAAAARQTKFVEELVKWMDSDDLALQNNDGNTAFCFAMASESTQIAEAMVKKNKNLPNIRGSKGVTPLYMAALFGHRNMVQYVYDMTRSEDLTLQDRIAILIATINSSLFDVAIKMLEKHPELAIARYKKGDMAQDGRRKTGKGETALHVLARMPGAFASPSGLQVWRRSINLGIKFSNNKMWMKMKAHELVENVWKLIIKLDDKDVSNLIREPSRVLFVAAELDNIGFITVLIQHYPDLIWRVDENKQSIFHVAVAHRQEKVFSLIYKIGAIKDLIASYKDDNHNNMLHLAATLPPRQLKTVSGAALQMQQELLWFKKVEKIVPPSYVKMENSNGKTPQDLFTEQHKDLLKEGEKWMRNTSTSCMLVATLIATVVFGVAFAVPGGNNNDTGIPIFFRTNSFKLFAISDALALFFSITSTLTFLSILTSRYGEEDFLKLLPIKLILGLTTLFISIASMITTFGASIFIVLNHGIQGVVIPIALFSCIPVILFALLQFPLFIDMILSTYRASILFQQKTHLVQ